MMLRLDCRDNSELPIADIDMVNIEEKILKELRKKPLTADEVQHIIGSEHQSNSAMFTDLKKRGIIEGSGNYRKTRMGRMAQVMQLSTPKSSLLPFLEDDE